jgi:hypothetical protein
MTKSQVLLSSDDEFPSDPVTSLSRSGMAKRLRKVNDDDFDDHPVNSLSSSGMVNRLWKVTDDGYGSKWKQVMMNCYSSKPLQLGDNDSVSVDLSRSEALSNAASDIMNQSSKVPHSRMNRKAMSKQRGMSCLPSSPSFSCCNVSKRSNISRGASTKRSATSTKKKSSHASISVARHLPSVESANWFSDNILGDGSHQKPFRLPSKGEDEHVDDSPCTPSMTLFSLDMDADINCGDVTSNIIWFHDRKAVPVNINNLFSTTSSNAEASVSMMCLVVVPLFQLSWYSHMNGVCFWTLWTYVGVPAVVTDILFD